MSFWDSSIIMEGRTTDNREVVIVRTGDGYELRSPGCSTLRSTDLHYLEYEFNKQVPNDPWHRNY